MILDSRTRSAVIAGNLGLSHGSFRVTLELNALFCVAKLNNSKQRCNGTSIAYRTVQCRLGAASFVQLAVSPGSTPRPSLSAVDLQQPRPRARDVSPGSTPRPSLSAGKPDLQALLGLRVSPGSTPRPSLSGSEADRPGCHRQVSPGSTPRPSLSVHHVVAEDGTVGAGVAGVYAPAFVERTEGRQGPIRGTVSPGSTPRPSLSAVDDPLAGLLPVARVAGVYAPAFVERCMRSWRCHE